MNGKVWRLSVAATLCGFVIIYGIRAAEDKPSDEGKAEDFKGKTFEIKEKGSASIILSFASGKKATITVKSSAKSDVNLFIFDDAKKVVAKDDSEGPDCEIAFTPKVSGKYTLEIRNLGPGDNKSTLKVAFK
jgi:hypothetical protein